jgi:hypothetical protein
MHDGRKRGKKDEENDGRAEFIAPSFTFHTFQTGWPAAARLPFGLPAALGQTV